jgi:hypothetical protein
MVHFENDYRFGLANQRKITPLLQNYFGSITHDEARWAKYDYYNDTSVFELKTRKNTKNKYPTTLMTCNKVVEGETRDIIFLFCYTDCLCYIKYDKELFDTFQKQMYSRIKEEFDEKEYYFIPIDKLTTITTF